MKITFVAPQREEYPPPGPVNMVYVVMLGYLVVSAVVIIAVSIFT